MILQQVGSFLLTICFVSVCAFAQGKELMSGDLTIDFTISSTETDYKTLIEKNVVEPFWVNSIVVTSDCHLNEEEMRYLLEFHEGDTVDAPKITKSVYYLFLKNKFSAIEFHIGPLKESGRSILIKFTSFWTLNKLKIKGFMIGKEAYRQYYLMEPGNIFDEQKHRESLVRMIERFKEAGSFKAAVEDSISYNENNKSVDVFLTLSPGNHFIIDHIDCFFVNEETLSDEGMQLKTKVKEQLVKRLYHKKYSKNLLNREIAIIKKLLFKKGFAQANVALTEKINRDDESIRLCFEITLKKSKELIFFGNHQFSADQLLDGLLSFGRATWSLPPSILAQEIINAYKDQGFWQVTVNVKEEEGRLFFIINEGERAQIKKIVIKGMHYFDPKKCINEYFNKVLTYCAFNSALLKGAIGELITQYNNAGFFDAKIAGQNLVSLNNKADCFLELLIDEGEQYTVKNIHIDQFPELVGNCPGSAVQDVLMPCTIELLETQKKWLQRQMELKGFLNATISLELIRNDNSVIVSWHIDLKRAQARFGKTVIVGNGNLPASMLLRELSYKNSASFDLDLVRQSLKKVRSLDLFDAVSLCPEPVNELFPERPMVLHVQPSDPFEVQLRFGVGLQQMTRPVRLSSLTYKLGGNFIIKNPFNVADHFNLKVEASRAYQDIVMRYERPWIFDKPVKFFAQGYSSSYKQPGFFTFKTGLYEVWQQGFLAGMSREYEHADAAITGGIEWMRTDIRKEYLPVACCVMQALAIDPCLLHNSIPYVFIEPTVMIDFTDGRMNPSHGSFTLVSIKGIVPLTNECGRLYSLKCLFEQSLYLPIASVILAIRGRLGYIWGLPLNHIQLIERFYLGGAHSIRSYYPDCAPPLGSFCDSTGQFKFVPQGGKAMAQGTVEVRFPIHNELDGVIFQDIGTLSNNPMSTVQGGKIVAATGFGVRYNTPIGPLRFDIGWKWSCHGKNDHAYAWYLALGNAF